MLLSSLEQWRTTVTSSGAKIILLAEEVSESLALSQAEVKVLWESDLIVAGEEDDLDLHHDMHDSLTKHLLSVGSNLIEARKLLRDEEFDKIVELNGTDHFECSINLKGRLSTVPLVSNVLKHAQEEILIIVAESRNIRCEKLLQSSFEVRLFVILNSLILVHICAHFLGGCNHWSSWHDRQKHHILR